MTDKQKEDFGHWLINNLQFTSVSNVQLIIDHVDRYFCQHPSEDNGLIEALKKIANHPEEPERKFPSVTVDMFKSIAAIALSQYNAATPKTPINREPEGIDGMGE